MDELNTPGFLTGAIVWIIILYYAAGESECVIYEACGRGDVVLFGIISLGLLVPAYFVAMLVSGVFNRK